MRRGILAPPRFRLKRGGMMKRFKLSALLLCLVFCLSACTQTELPDAPSESLGDSSLPGSDIISQSKTEPEPYKITLNDELMKTNNVNAMNGGYIMEEERYIVYRHPADNGRLYRYEKATGAVKVLYNTTALNGFLHSIQFFDNKIYFVTRAESDESPTLYCTDIEGESLERLIENVGDDYIVTDDMIYYTTYRESNEAIFYLYRYDRKRKESALMRPGQCEYLNLVGDELYFVDYAFTGGITGGGGMICKINVKTNNYKEIPIYDQQGMALAYIERFFYLDGSFYFMTNIDEKGVNTGLMSYNLETEKINQLINIENFHEIIQKEYPHSMINEFGILNPNDYYIEFFSGDDSGYRVYTLIQVKDQKNIVQSQIDGDHIGGNILLFVEGKAVLYEPFKNDGQVIGGEKLMVKAGET